MEGLPTLVLDLDHTLLDATNFKLALAKALNLSETEWNLAYEGFVRDNGVFNPEAFLKGVSNEEREAFMNVTKTLNRFLYPDVLTTLPKLQTIFNVVVLTYGDKTWQQLKLNNLRFPTGVTTIATDQPKVETLSTYHSTGLVMVDDRATELDAAKQQFHDLKAFWMVRPNGKYATITPQVEHTQVHTLNELISKL